MGFNQKEMPSIHPSAMDGLSPETKLREFRAKRLAVAELVKDNKPLRNPDGSPTDILRGYIELFSNEILLEERRKRNNEDKTDLF